MAYNTKNEDALIYGIDRNSYGGYIDGVAVEVSVYPTNSQQLVSDLTKNSHQPRQLITNSAPSAHQSSTDVSLTNTYNGTRIGGDVSAANMCDDGAVDLNGDHKNIDLIHQYIKDESDDSQCAILTPVPEIQNGNKSLQHYMTQVPYQQYSSFNLLQTDSAQYPINSPLLFYSNSNHQKQFYGALERKVFGEDHVLNYKDRLSGSLNSSPYFDGKLSWFANSLQTHTIGHQMGSDTKLTENILTRQTNENSSEIMGINLELGKDKKKVKLRQEKREQTLLSEEELAGKFECTQCSYRGQSAAILKIHQRTHSGERPFQCHLCDYRAGQKHNVTKHILVHMNEKPYKCQFCEYRCAQKNNLIVHERTHTGIKPFACTFCEYKTVQKPNLVKHMYLHTNEKPFACEYCDYRCVQKTNLKKHVQKHINHVNDSTKRREPSPSKSFSCSLCPYKCAYRLGLVKHEQTKHTMALAKLNNMSESNSLPQNYTMDSIPVPMKSISEDVQENSSLVVEVSPLNQFKEEP